MSTLDAILSSPPRPFGRDLARLIMGLIGAFLLWAMFAGVQEVSIANGEVVPQEKIQTIQHLEGGIVEDILVQEGSRVEKDQPLIQLNLTSFVSSREELEINLQGLLLKRERLLAESRGDEELVFSESAKDYRPALLQSEQLSFSGRQAKQASNLQVQKEQVEQRRLDIQQLQTERDSIQRNLAVLTEKLRISKDLVKDKLTSKLDHLQLKSEVEELTGRLEIIRVAIPRAEVALHEAEERYNTEELSFRNAALEELTQTEVDIARTQELLGKAEDQVLRTTIKSPIAGTVKSLEKHTIGGVIRPGETIMEIVPESENLLIESRLNPNDIGFVKVGQRALVKFLTYDFARYGGLDGEVVFVSPDSHMDDQTGEPYFRVTIRTDENYLGSEPGIFPITAGMQTTVDIHTGKKTVMEYLLKPVIRIKEEAFRER